VECGYKCTLHNCDARQDLIAHHINFNPSDNRIENIMMACPTHAAMADKGKIDRKSCRKFKEILKKTPPPTGSELLETFSQNIEKTLKKEISKALKPTTPKQIQTKN